MIRYIKKCKKCEIYTLKEICPCCGHKTVEINPPNVGLEDPYIEYRIKKRLEKNGRRNC